MKKSLREQLVKQWLNTFMWSRYLANQNGDECSLIVRHHQGFDSEELTTDCFDLNFSLLKILREVLQTTSPPVFCAFFALEEDLPRKVQQRTKLYQTFKNANDNQLASICPLFGGCLFQPRQQDSIIRYLSQTSDPLVTNSETVVFSKFVEMYWIAAWQHATKTPLLTPSVFGLNPELVDILRFTTSQRILQFIHCHLDTQFIIKMNESVLYAASESPLNPTLRLFQVLNLIQSRTEAHRLELKEEDNV